MTPRKGNNNHIDRRQLGRIERIYNPTLILFLVLPRPAKISEVVKSVLTSAMRYMTISILSDLIHRGVYMNR